jgi:predicted phosphoribosyltransferase
LAAELGGAFVDTLVLGIPRGGAVVAARVAKELGLEMDVLLTARICPQCFPGAVFGTACEDGAVVLDTSWPGFGWTPEECVAAQAKRHGKSLAEAAGAYRRGKARAPLAGRDVIIVDDGALTGRTMAAAVRAARHASARRVAVALPVAPADVAEALTGQADEVVALRRPVAVGAVGSFYEDFRPVRDEAIAGIMAGGREAGAE